MATDSRSLLEIAQSYSAPGLSVVARFEGTLPGMLMHSADSMRLAAEAAEKFRAEKGGRVKFIPPADLEAEWGLYRRPDDGVLYLPAQNILRCFVEAAKAFKMPKSRASMKNAAAAGITVPFEVGFGFPILDPDTNQPVKTWKIDTRRVVIQRAAIMRSRPTVERWAVEASFLLDADAVPPHVFAEIVGYAGARIGVCDFRPEKGGQFGRFTVTGLEVV